MEVQSAMGSGVFIAVVEQNRSDEQAAANALDRSGNSSNNKKSEIPPDSQATLEFDSAGLLKPIVNRGSVFDLFG